MGFWAVFFGWPGGQVWPNLVADGITTVGGVSLVGWRFLKKLRAEHEQHRALMAQQLDEHHQAVIAAVTPPGGTS